MAIDVLAKIAGAKPTQSGQFFSNPGHYRVKVQKVLFKPDAFKGPTFIAEHEILSATKNGSKKLTYDAAAKDFKQTEVDPHPIGDQRSMVVVLKDNNDSTYGNVISYIMALTGLPQSAINKEGIEQLCADDQPMAGKVIDVDVWDKPLKSKDGVFTNLKWTHVDEPKAAAAPAQEAAPAAQA